MASLARVSPTLSDIEFGYVRERTTIVEDDGDEEEIVWPIRTSDSSNTTSPSPEDAPSSLNNRYSTYRPSHRRATTMGQHQFSSVNGTKGFHSTHELRQELEMVYSFDDVFDFELVRGDGGTREYVPPNERIRTRPRGHRKTQSDSTLAFPRTTKMKGKPRPLPQTEKKYELLSETWAVDADGIVAPMECVQLRTEPGANKSRPQSKKSATPEVAADSAIGQTQNKSRPQRGPKRQKGGAAAKWREKADESKNTSAKEPGPIPPPKPAIDQTNRSVVAVVKSPRQREEKPRKVKNKAAVKPTVKADPPTSEVTELPSPAPSTPRGLGARSVVDDISENGDALVLSNVTPASDRDCLLRMAYDESVKFMDAFVAHPDHYTSQASKLTFLQALIVELGLVSTDGPAAGLLPGTLTAAKALIKSHAFLNVRDYLEMRAQGVEALRGAMKTSRRALVRELRGRRRGEDKRGRAPLGWVKDTGLTVLLVTL